MKLFSILFEGEEDPNFAQTPPSRLVAGTTQRRRVAENNFSIEKLKEISARGNLEEILKYAQSNLQQVNKGSTRDVFNIDNQFVLKVAIPNTDGVEQNKAEVAVCSVHPELFATIKESDPNGLWIIAEFLPKPASYPEFEKLTGLTMPMLNSGLYIAFSDKLKQGTYVRDEDKQAFEQIKNNPFFKSIVDIIKTCHYAPGDIAKLDSWRIKDGKLKLADSGFKLGQSVSESIKLNFLLFK